MATLGPVLYCCNLLIRASVFQVLYAQNLAKPKPDTAVAVACLLLARHVKISDDQPSVFLSLSLCTGF